MLDTPQAMDLIKDHPVADAMVRAIAAEMAKQINPDQITMRTADSIGRDMAMKYIKKMYIYAVTAYEPDISEVAEVVRSAHRVSNSQVNGDDTSDAICDFDVCLGDLSSQVWGLV